MISEDRAWLAALQLSDSQFPSGAFTHSHGLEALVADGWLDGPAALALVVAAHLSDRLATADLPALFAGHAAARSGAHETVREIDLLLSATKLAREEREASTRVGRRIAFEVARLAPGDTALATFVNSIAVDSTPGNASVAQGVAAAALDIPARLAAIGACHSLVASLLSAAMRLTRLGHGDAQRVLRDAQPAMAEAVEIAGSTPWQAMRSTAIQLDVAMARHDGLEARMFAS